MALRPRRGWESADLGHVLVRQWAGVIYRPWLLAAIPVSVALLVLLGRPGLFVLWWLRPFGDVLILHVLSRAVFGEVLDTRRSLAEWLGLCRRLFWGCLFPLRLHPGRHLHLPTWQLEDLRGTRRRRRINDLALAADQADAGFIIGFWLLELGLALAGWSAMVMFVPEWMEIDWSHLFDAQFETDSSAPGNLMLPGLFVLSWLLLQPHAVAAGFATYINRRTRLEGWDIEIGFRRLGEAARERREVEERAARDGVGSGAAVLLLVGSMLLGGGAIAMADTPGTTEVEDTGEVVEEPMETAPSPDPWDLLGPAEVDDPREVADRILEDEAFGRLEKVMRWKPKEKAEKEEEREPLDLGWLKGIAWLGQVVGWLGSSLPWVIGGVVLFVLVLVLRRWLRQVPLDDELPEVPALPDSISGLDIRPEALPDDVAGQAAALWRAGRTDAALGLLYRGALSCLVRRDAVPLRESFTELDCLRVARQCLDSDPSRYFESLTRAWQSTAYAHRPPGDEQAQELFDDFDRHFEVTT
ncbi:MAG: DUF4129 domain-containing protein [Acidobacteriota bacterium]